MRPLHTMPSGKDGHFLWTREEVGEARKRIQCRRFIRKHSSFSKLIQTDDTEELVRLAKLVRDVYLN